MSSARKWKLDLMSILQGCFKEKCHDGWCKLDYVISAMPSTSGVLWFYESLESLAQTWEQD